MKKDRDIFENYLRIKDGVFFGIAFSSNTIGDPFGPVTRLEITHGPVTSLETLWARYKLGDPFGPEARLETPLWNQNGCPLVFETYRNGKSTLKPLRFMPHNLLTGLKRRDEDN